jgi:tetratricopeptide (TPR) repeat protein
MYKEMESWENAFKDYTRAIAIRADFEEALLRHGEIYCKAGYYREGVEDFTRTINLGGPNRVHGYGWRAAAYREMAERAENEALREEYERKAVEDTEMARMLGAYAEEDR